MASDPVRVRIAPSPTGEPHIGTAYTALVNMAFARKHGGQFIIRIEDTDQNRLVLDAEQKILASLKWLGFEWDEGPDVGGPYGPYRQTERKTLYAEYAQKLLDDGHAFKCFCTPERLETMRALQRKKGLSPKYDGHCLNLSAEDIAAQEKAGTPMVVRMKIPREGVCTFTDGIYGEVSIPWADVDMQVLMKSDGLPTYHLAVVVDDHAMKISHVLRGEEWLSSTPKHIKLFEYFGWEPTAFIHLPVLRNLDRTKLSKRKSPTSVSWFERQGYLPAAILNFLGHFYVKLAEGEEELMTLPEIVEKFDLTAVSKAGPVFDLAKLDWFNGRWLRERLSESAYLAQVQKWAGAGDILNKGLVLAKSRITRFADLPALVGFLLSGAPAITRESFAGLKTDEAQTTAILYHVTRLADELPEWGASQIFEALKGLEGPLGLKARLITAPLYVAISGSAQSLPLTDSMALLGRAMCRDRLKRARDLFGWQRLEKAAAQPTPQGAADGDLA
jgi:glutamyl-tRNA synthetase